MTGLNLTMPVECFNRHLRHPGLPRSHRRKCCDNRSRIVGHDQPHVGRSPAGPGTPVVRSIMPPVFCRGAEAARRWWSMRRPASPACR